MDILDHCGTKIPAWNAGRASAASTHALQNHCQCLMKYAAAVTYLDTRPFVKRLDTSIPVDPDPRNDIDVRDRVDTTTGPSKPVAVLQANLKHAVETLRLVKVTWVWRVRCFAA